MKTCGWNTETRVVVIDDNREAAENIASILSLARYNVTTAFSGVEGIEAVRRVHPDIILCDVAMPGMSGFDVLKELHNDATTSLIPFVFLTGKCDFADFRKGMNAGADDYVTKPFDGRDLLRVIETRIRKRNLMAMDD